MIKAFLLGLFLVQPVFADELSSSSFQVILQEVQGSAFNSSSCVPYLKTLETEMTKANIRNFEPNIADTSWQIREVLHRRLPEFDLNCVNQIHSIFRQLRSIEDYVLEHASNVADMYPEGKDFEKELLIPMKDAAPYYVFNRRAEDLSLKNTISFKPGDLMIARGLSFLSAMIARLGNRGTQFSHVVMLAEDGPHSQRTLESYVGSGVAFYDIDYALKNENSRLLWLRSKDQDLAARAAKYMGDEVTALSAKHDKIYYDYDLDFKNHDTMSCAEVAQTAYEVASNGAVHIPQYENEINGAKSLLSHLGLPAGKTFEPGDMEIDPRFELMGEFKDLRLTRDSRHKDVIMTKVFEWMNERHYQLHDSMKSKMAGGLIFDLRRTFMWPMVKKLLKLDDFSKEIPRKMIRTVELLSELGMPLIEKLREIDNAHKLQTGWSMTEQELMQAMEDFRAQDEELYRNRTTRKQSKFHQFFRAN